MSDENVRLRILERMNTNWDGSVAQVEYPNLKFEPTRGTPYIRMSILLGDSNQVAMGGESGNQFRHVGLVAFQIFIPEFSGTKTLSTIRDALNTLWRAQELTGGILIRSPEVTEVGPTKNGWYQSNSVFPFQWDEIS